MCGISGFVQFTNRPGPGPHHLLRSSEILAHRGPDDEGFLLISNDYVCVEAFSGSFGKPETRPDAVHLPGLAQTGWKAGAMHRRLSIIDPKPEGHQPFPNHEKSVWVVFNGEIYNYKKLRARLQKLGYLFDTETDTEVLLNAYLEWGQACVHQLDGMWAFTVFDTRTHRVFASTDPAGIKPLYYTLTKSAFFFTSEIKAFKAFDVGFSENEKAVARFLVYGQSDETSDTLFAGIQRLRGGFSIDVEMDTGAFSIKPYQSVFAGTAFDYHPLSKERERVDHIQSLLVEMIGLRLQADVPLGVCLSGGIDSSTVAGLVAFADRHLHSAEPRKAFMATLPIGSQHDESPFAREVAARLGFEFHTTCPTGQQFADAVSDLIYTLDEPPPGLNAFSQYAVFQKVAEQNITVTLDGQGADEVFAGYPRHQEVLLAESLAHGAPAWDSISHGKELMVNGIRSLLPVNLALPLLELQKPEFEMLLPETIRLAGAKGNFYLSLNECLATEFSSTSLPFLLKAADRNSMRWSIESRMPFADFQPLVDYLFQIPGSAKIQAGYTKYLLRKAAQPFVSQSILKRKDKVGFAAPNAAWIAALPTEMWHTLLAIPQPWIDKALAGKWIVSNKNMDLLLLWRIFSYLLWRKTFL